MTKNSKEKHLEITFYDNFALLECKSCGFIKKVEIEENETVEETAQLIKNFEMIHKDCDRENK